MVIFLLYIIAVLFGFVFLGAVVGELAQIAGVIVLVFIGIVFLLAHEDDIRDIIDRIKNKLYEYKRRVYHLKNSDQKFRYLIIFVHIFVMIIITIMVALLVLRMWMLT